jgi:hypothetical protein
MGVSDSARSLAFVALGWRLGRCPCVGLRPALRRFVDLEGVHDDVLERLTEAAGARRAVACVTGFGEPEGRGTNHAG